MEKKYAYVTLLTTNSFMSGLMVLVVSMRRSGCSYPIYCVVTPEITQENRNILLFMGIHIIDRPEIPMTQAIHDFNTSHEHDFEGWYKAFSKFHVFGLEEFDKIVYIDCDMIVRENLDCLFEKPHMTGCIDAEGLEGQPFDYLIEGDKYFQYFNSGLLVIEPKMSLYEDIMKFVENLVPDRILADQNILALYYPEWKDQDELHLLIYYNIFSSCIDTYLKKTWFEMDKVKIFHFLGGQKPWTLNTASYKALNDVYGQIGVEYLNILNEIIRSLEVLGFHSEDLKIIP